MKLGKFEIHALSDGTFLLDGGQMFGVVPKTLWERRIPADAKNRIRLSLTCLLIQAGGKNLLVETGIGDKFDAKFQDIHAVDHFTTLPGELRKLGLSPEDIHIVINSHLHFDHCGWNTVRDNGKLVPTFPRARYFVQRGEWEHALHPTERDRASYVADWFLAGERQTEFLQGEAEIVPGIRVEVAAGHTRNLQCVRIESEGQTAFFLSDLIPTAAHLPYPWVMSFDLYPLETLENKKRLLPQLVASHALAVFPHDPGLTWAYLVETEGRITVAPVA